MSPEKKDREEVFLDLNSKVGDESKITLGGGLLTNVVIKVDSIAVNAQDKMFFLEVRRIWKVSDEIFLKRMELSLGDGIKSITIVDGEGWGQTFTCK